MFIAANLSANLLFMSECAKAKAFGKTLLEHLKFSTYFCNVKKYYRHIILLVCLPSLLLSTAGFSIHTLYCLCKGEMAVSLFFIPDQCDAEPVKMAESCCKKGKTCTAPDTQSEKKPHNCNEHGVWFAKMDTPFIFATDNQENQPLQLFVLPPVWDYAFAKPLFVQADFLLPQDHAPPPAAGMDLRRWMKSYRC